MKHELLEAGKILEKAFESIEQRLSVIEFTLGEHSNAYINQMYRPVSSKRKAEERYLEKEKILLDPRTGCISTEVMNYSDKHGI
jgi:hypothetical protein